MSGGWSLEVDISSHVGKVMKSRRKMFSNPERRHMHPRVALFICHLFKMKRDFVWNESSKWNKTVHDFTRNPSYIVDF